MMDTAIQNQILMNLHRVKHTPSSRNRYKPKVQPVPIPKHLKITPFRWVWRKVHKKKEDCIIVVCGATGKGKTTFATAFAELLDVTFNGGKRFPYFTTSFDYSNFNMTNPKESVTYSNFDQVVPRFCYGINQARQYWEWLKKRHAEGKRTEGIVGVVDEVQTLWNSREFYTPKNKEAITQLVTGRYLKTINVLIGPEYNVLDKQILRRAHLIIEVLDKGVDKVSGKHAIWWLPKIPVFLDSKKPPILRYMRAADKTILDKPFLVKTPSQQLYSLVEAKELFWKNAEKDDTGNLIDPAKPKTVELDSSEKKAKKIAEMATKNRETRHRFLTVWLGKVRYNAKRIAAEMQVPLSWGDFFIPYFERWDKEEKVDIQTMTPEI